MLCQITEPAFDDVQPRTARRSKVNVETFVSLEPSLHLRMLVRRVVVHDQVQVEFRWCFPVDFLQELQPFLVSVLRHAFGDDLSFIGDDLPLTRW